MPNAWEKGIFMLPIDKELYKLNKFLREQVEDYIASIENSSANAYEIYDELIEQINKECKLLNNRIEQQTLQILHDNKIPGLLGGDHSTPLGNIKAVIQKYPEVTILHIDAHADLRPAYEGFTYSHASIMYNVLEETSIKKIVQVGIRDFCHQEYELSQSDHRILTFYDKKLKELYFQGRPWGSIVLDIIKNLGHEVYISLDIDALQPYYCPDTGTPVPGGLSFDEVTYLIDSVVKSGKKIVGQKSTVTYIGAEPAMGLAYLFTDTAVLALGYSCNLAFLQKWGGHPSDESEIGYDTSFELFNHGPVFRFYILF
jgi:agmatinase